MSDLINFSVSFRLQPVDISTSTLEANFGDDPHSRFQHKIKKIVHFSLANDNTTLKLNLILDVWLALDNLLKKLLDKTNTAIGILRIICWNAPNLSRFVKLYPKASKKYWKIGGLILADTLNRTDIADTKNFIEGVPTLSF